MNDEQNTNCRRFLELKKTIHDMEEELDTLKKPVLDALMGLPSGKDTKIEGEFGHLSITMRKTWTFPQALIDAGEQLKIDKKTAQQTGDAKFTEEPSLYFRTKKSTV